MQFPKGFNTSCKGGSLRISDYSIRLHSMTGKPNWQMPVQLVTGIEETSRKLMATIVIHTTQGDYTVEWVPPAEIGKLQQSLLAWQAAAPELSALPPQPPSLPAVQAPLPAPAPVQKQKPSWLLNWWEDERKFTHVDTYTKQRDLERDIEQAYRHGWEIQGQRETGGKMSGKKIIAGAIIAGPVGAFLGAGKSKEKIVVTFVRTSEWRTAHQQ